MNSESCISLLLHFLIKLKIGNLTRLQRDAEHRCEFRLLEFLYCMGKEA